MSEPITKEMIKNWTADQMSKEMSNPERRAEIVTFLANPESRGVIAELSAEIPAADEPIEEQVIASNPAVEEFNQAEADRQAEAVRQQEIADRAAAQAVEAEALRAANVTVYKDASGNITKIVKEYQVIDETTGNPIGRPTHLEARNWPELSRKEEEAHTQATRAFHRLKNQKTTFKPVVTPKPAANVPLLSDEDRIQAALDLNSPDEEVVIKADRKLRADSILRDQQKDVEAKEAARQRLVSDEFKSIHAKDFNPCQANAVLISGYLRENNLEWTLDNLELAFAAKEPELAPFAAPVSEETTRPVDNTPVVPTATPSAPAAVIPQPAAPEVPAAPAAAANPPAPIARPGVNTGLVPGQLSAQRPIAKPAGLTKKDIAKWTPEQMKKEMKNPARLAEINRVLAGRSA